MPLGGLDRKPVAEAPRRTVGHCLASPQAQKEFPDELFLHSVGKRPSNPFASGRDLSQNRSQGVSEGTQSC